MDLHLVGNDIQRAAERLDQRGVKFLAGDGVLANPGLQHAARKEGARGRLEMVAIGIMEDSLARAFTRTGEQAAGEEAFRRELHRLALLAAAESLLAREDGQFVRE